jgi:hypothetical protein
MVLLIFVLSLTAMLYAVPQKTKAPLPASVADLHNAKLIEVKDAAGNLVLSGTFAAASDDDEDGDIDDVDKDDEEDEFELTATLTGGTNASRVPRGRAEIEIERDNKTTKQEIYLKVENVAALAKLTLWIDGRQISTFTTNKKGEANLTLTSRRPIS